jgi:hypothetical protein
MIPEPTFWSAKEILSRPVYTLAKEAQGHATYSWKRQSPAIDLVLILQFGLVQVNLIRCALTCSAPQSFS